MDEDMAHTSTLHDTVNDEEVVTLVDNEVMSYKIDSIVTKTLVTKRVRNSLNNVKKSLKTLITIENKDNNYLVSICGQNRDKVIETKMKFNELLATSRRLRPFTHLITVPFKSQHLVQEFSQFKDNVLKDANSRDKGIDETLFQKPFKLHLTFCVLVLLDAKEVLLAKQLLRQSLHQIVRPIVAEKPLIVSLEGLAVMKGRPNRAHVVYAQVKDDSNRFQSIADQIVDTFVKSGLLEESCVTNQVKLHITFMNSLFKQRFLIKNIDPKTESKKRIKRECFDAKDIIESYSLYKFSDCLVESIQLNDIKSTTSDGYYGLVDEINLQNV